MRNVKARRRSGSKTKAERIHARVRLAVRYGLESSALDEAVKQIQGGRAHFIESQSHRVSVFDVELRGKQVRVVYDKERGQLITALPPRAIEPVARCSFCHQLYTPGTWKSLPLVGHTGTGFPDLTLELRGCVHDGRKYTISACQQENGTYLSMREYREIENRKKTV